VPFGFLLALHSETCHFGGGGSFFFPLFARGCCLCFRFAFSGFGCSKSRYLFLANAFLFGNAFCRRHVGPIE
jgi:hypothetical protein